MSDRYALVDLMTDVGFQANEPIGAVLHIVKFGGHFRVVQDGRMADGLAFDEMLGQVVNLTHPDLGRPRYSMETRDEHTADRARHEARMAEISRKETAL